MTLEYDQTYAADPTATPLSVTLPLVELSHVGSRLNSWLANLLPDNPRVLDRWAQRFQVSASSPYALLAHVGADCAGAVQFLPETRPELLREGGIDPLSEHEVGERLRGLLEDPGAWTPLHETGQFSLAGAQAKIALRALDNGWGEPYGAQPTSHILKPPIPGLAHQVVNEHLCLRTARRLGLPAAESYVGRFSDQIALVVTRYDRALDSSGDLQRIHQEDLCQALGLPPSSKYQADGGPGPARVVDLLRTVLGPTQATESVDRFVRALALSWVLGATDAHAKNYGLLLIGPDAVLAPLYDVNSVLPYLAPERRGVADGHTSLHTARLAMSIGGSSSLAEIDRSAWKNFAAQCRLDVDQVLEDVLDVVNRAPKAIGAVVEGEAAAGSLDTAQMAFASKLARAVERNSGLCRSAALGRGAQRRHR